MDIIRKFVPLQVRKQIRRFWYRIIFRKTPVHFLHISKTGGTALQMALQDHLVTKDYFLEFHHHLTTLKVIPKGEKVVFFVRDPVTRFVSAFNTRLRKGRPRNNSPWTKAEQDAFSHFKNPNELAEGLSSSNMEIKSAATSAMRGINHVNLFQTEWVVDIEYLQLREADIFFIGQQEHLDSDFERLKAKLKIGKSLMLPGNDIDSHRTPMGYNVSLSKRGEQNISEWYKSDYRLLDFSHSMNFEKS